MGFASIRGRAMYPEMAKMVDTPTRREHRAPPPPCARRRTLAGDYCSQQRPRLGTVTWI